MYRKILVAYNGSPESRSALQECIQLRPPASTEIHLLAVIHFSPHGMAGGYAPEIACTTRTQWMRQELEEGQALMVAAGLNPVTHLEIGEPVDVISTLADQLKIGLVIVGHSRRKTLAMRWWRGDTDALLVERLNCSILVALHV
ncbi:UspA domain protein [Collimonas arenae]|uniref:UspA domain protein n=1 Tax=Collimonas arenae TaxID=279058 RepID=A0A0A1FDX2_9BURK|nr:universal stress protein [Collimonas arenae]AIY42953.1 UspA domain protein [Collimonas arenae]